MLPQGTLAAFGLYLVRTSAFVLSAPPLGTASSFAAYKVGLIGILSLFLFALGGRPVESAASPIEFGAMAMREALIGLALGIVVQLAILVVRVAGELIGQEMGFTMASVADPVTGVATPVVAQVHEGLFLLGFLAVDGHHLLIRALSDSFARAPVGAVALAPGVPGTVLSLFGEMFTAGIVFAGPVMVLLLVVSLLIGIVARAVPQIQVLELGFTLRIAAAFLAMYAFAPLLAPALGSVYESLQDSLEGMLLALEG